MRERQCDKDHKEDQTSQTGARPLSNVALVESLCVCPFCYLNANRQLDIYTVWARLQVTDTPVSPLGSLQARGMAAFSQESG